jgi:hypothetical protein
VPCPTAHVRFSVVRLAIGREQEMDPIDVLWVILEERSLKIGPRPIKVGFCFGRNHQVWENWGLKVGGKCAILGIRFPHR